MEIIIVPQTFCIVARHSACRTRFTLRSGKPGKHRKMRRRTGQATLEMVLALVAGLLFVVASMKVWLFLAQTIVEQQKCYTWSRRAAGQNENPGLGLSNPLCSSSGLIGSIICALTPPAYGNPFWGSAVWNASRREWEGNPAQKPKLSIFGPNQFPYRCP